MKFRISKSTLICITVFLLLLAARIPFYMTHHVQEDAYITLRCAENLAGTGVYGFNPGERVSASTSHLYVFLAALVRLIVGKGAFIPAVQVVNTILFLFGAYFTAGALVLDRNKRLWLWALISLLPVSLMISYSGMETSLLVFLFGLGAYLIRRRKKPVLLWLCIALLPWVRPDAVAYSIILVVWSCLQERQVKAVPLLALGFGVGGLALFNYAYFGAVLNQSIVAKSLSQGSFTLQRFFTNLRLVFAENVGGIFNPIRTKFFDQLGYLFLMIVIAGVAYFIWRNRKEPASMVAGLALAAVVFGVPAAYAFGGVVFPWYMWPCTFLAYVVISSLVVEWIYTSRRFTIVEVTMVSLAVLGMALAQWAYSYNWGMKEYAYRGGIGRYLASVSKTGETLFLEPAGYIPFYSDLYTYDEVGLVSPQVVHYREVYQDSWWMEFVEDYTPDWIVQRGQIAEKMTYQGHVFTNKEWKWFTANYNPVKEFHFNPGEYVSSPVLLRLLQLGEADDYYLFELKPK